MESVEDLLKKFYPNVDSDKIKVYINIGCTMIKNYLNPSGSDTLYTNEYIKKVFVEALFIIVRNALVCDESKGIKSKKQGEKSITYYNDKSFYITSDIKAMLPSPRTSKINLLG